jgi:hypothetical protein
VEDNLREVRKERRATRGKHGECGAIIRFILDGSSHTDV